MRIIAGKWRSRRLRVPTATGLRPTPDAMRETLFNWLANHIVGARCLDLFAGSGALGFEAASRGAAQVVMVEKDARVARALREAKTMLDAGEVTIHQGDAQRVCHKHLAGNAFDVVFLDPPFQADLLQPAVTLLTESQLLSDTAKIYMESAVQLAPVDVPTNWELLKDRRGGRSRFLLYAA